VPQGAQAQSTATDEQVRTAIAAAIGAREGRIVSDQPGSLVMDVGGSAGAAYLAGPFRNAMKMPMRISVATSSGPGGTGVSVEVGSHGTGGGFASGGLIGASKHRKGEKAWLDAVLESIPARVS
jgi:hypothetical protein